MPPAPRCDTPHAPSCPTTHYPPPTTLHPQALRSVHLSPPIPSPQHPHYHPPPPPTLCPTARTSPHPRHPCAHPRHRPETPRTAPTGGTRLLGCEYQSASHAARRTRRFLSTHQNPRSSWSHWNAPSPAPLRGTRQSAQGPQPPALPPSQGEPREALPAFRATPDSCQRLPGSGHCLVHIRWTQTTTLLLGWQGGVECPRAGATRTRAAV